MKRALILAILLVPTLASAHARLKPGVLVPRSMDAGLKTGPCGGIARTSTPAQLNPGQTITVEWEETINHPGRFEFYFSPAGDANWQLLKTVNDTQDDTNVPHNYSTTLTLPNVNCTACTIQMIQVMTENPAAPSNYYSCADIRLGTSSTTDNSSTSNNPSCPKQDSVPGPAPGPSVSP